MKKIKSFKIYFVLTCILSQYVCFNIVPEANATGGAFPHIKHGGGTTDGNAPYDHGNGPGVDRSVNPEFSSYYHDQASEAGKYKGGECPQCHEPHASFGGSEPPPNSGGDSGPDPYLLLKEYATGGNYAELCWYCHDYFNNINGSGSPLGMGKWKFYQGRNVYSASSHYSPPSGSFYWPGDGASSPIWPRKNRISLPTGNRGSCLNCHTPHGIMASDAGSAYDTSSPDGSGGVPASRQTVSSGNPSVNRDYLIPRQLIAWEETLCEKCHDSGGPSTKNIQDEINKRHVSGYSGHPVDDTSLSGRHVVNESLPITKKHVECYDCHNPHAARQDNKLEGMRYIDINGIVRDPATGASQPHVHEVCFKCHGDSFDCTMPYKAYGASDGSAGCSPLTEKHRGNETGSDINDQRGASNKRKEFNPNTIIGTAHGADDSKTNGGFHPVAAPGRNHSPQLCRQLETAFNLDCSSSAAAASALQNLTINCTDCHNNDAISSSTRGPVTVSNLRSTDKSSAYSGSSPIGPHGSTNYRILRANYKTYVSSGSTGWGGGWGGGGMGGWSGSSGDTTAIVNAHELCFRCHDDTPFTSSASSSWTNFYASGGNWGNSLHFYHLRRRTGDGEYIKCHECHNNVHSNVEAKNTQYYSGSSCCSGFPSDGNTHLINFGPSVTPDNYSKPAWYTGSGGGWGGGATRCNLRCHGKTMSSCDYLGAYDGGPAGGGWC